ncbi:MAG: threonine/serine dehydratase [Sulfolobales archaeon]
MSFFTLRDVYRARSIISKYIVRTPLRYSRRLSRILGLDVYLKLESIQVTRSFKVRGGLHYMSMRSYEAVKKGVITASMGNHAQSVAYAASIYGARAIIVMPHGIARTKVEALRDLGAEIVFHGSIFEEAREYAEKLAEEKGYLYIHPINEPLLYPGVATMHLENIEDLPDVDIIVNPIGGGSGASGAVVVARSIDPGIKVIGVQAEGAPSFYLSWKQGKLVSVGKASTIAEGLATSKAYELPFNILRDRIDDIVLVSDEEMINAIKILAEIEGIIAEPAGAASLAAIYKIRDKLQGKKVIAMITGGNIDPEVLASWLAGSPHAKGISSS